MRPGRSLPEAQRNGQRTQAECYGNDAQSQQKPAAATVNEPHGANRRTNIDRANAARGQDRPERSADSDLCEDDWRVVQDRVDTAQVSEGEEARCHNQDWPDPRAE